MAAGLLYLHLNKAAEDWSSPFRAWLPIIFLYLLVNIFLAIVPFIPPTGPLDPDGYPYYVFPVVGVGVLLGGAVYWALWTRLWPKFRGERLVAEHEIDGEGRETVRYVSVKVK